MVSGTRTARLGLAMATLASLLVGPAGEPAAGGAGQSRPAIRASYAKAEHEIPMRDGTRLYTAVYSPVSCVEGGYPILLQRTPYGAGPYGADAYRSQLGPSEHFERDRFIVVYQDVRGRHMSEGIWEEVRPHMPRARRGPTDTDETTDAFDTIDWLIGHVPCHNGRVGMWGISYPGFYVSAGAIEAHPALRAVSPQAPVTDYYLGDDAYHNGALMLAHNFGFYVNFPPRGPDPQRSTHHPRFEFGTPDAYRFYLEMGSLREGTMRYGLEDNPYWTSMLAHQAYDAFWQERSIWKHFHAIAPAVLTVGGWYDAENLMGALRTHKTIAAQSPGTSNRLVMGPWTHGSWASGDGSETGNLVFGDATAAFYREHIEFPFFAHHLKGRPMAATPTAWIYETGRNRWRQFDTWPPRQVRSSVWYLHGGGGLSRSAPEGSQSAYDEYLSDPSRPVPLVGHVAPGMPADYMTDDQRFASTRPDVLVYQTPPLDQDMTVLGPIHVTLHVSTSGTDADFVVKVIDVYPGDFEQPGAGTVPMGGYQQLVRGEPFRGKFRRGFEQPMPFAPGEPDVIEFELGDVAHTFRAGHRVMVQVQSSWFPLVDRNPQVFMSIPDATTADFTKATQRVYRGGTRLSSITLQIE